MKPRNRLLFGLLCATALIAAVAWWLRGRATTAPAEATKAASAAGVAPATSSPARSTYRRRPLQPVLLSQGEVAEAEAGAIGSFEGRVVSRGDFKGVARAELTFVGPGGAHSARTSEDGSFHFSPPSEGFFEIALVTCEGFFPFTAELGQSPLSFVARRGAGLRGIQVHLTPAVRTLGLVVSPKGEPVARATVRVLDALSGELGLAGHADHFETNEAGEFTFSAPDGSVLEARHADFDPGRARLGFSAQVSHRLVIRLAERGTEPARVALRGRVLDDAGTLLAEVKVSAWPEGKAFADDAPLLGGGSTTGTDGQFVIHELAPGRYTVSAHSPGLAPAVLRGVDAKPTSAPLELVLRRGATLEGQVTRRPEASPVAAFTVVIAERRGLAHETLRVETSFDAEGRYRIEGLNPGRFVVSVSAEGLAPSEDRELQIAGPVTQADFELGPGGSVVGSVFSAGTETPIVGAKLSLEGRLAGSRSETAVPISSVAITDGAGRFVLGGLAPGEHSVLVAAAEHHGRIAGPFAVRGSESVGPTRIELTKTKPGEKPSIELFGIGAVLTPQGEVLLIGKVLPGGGAEEAGVKPGDVVHAVDGIAVGELGFQGSIQRIRGPEGTQVTLTLARGGKLPLVDLAVSRRRIRT